MMYVSHVTAGDSLLLQQLAPKSFEIAKDIFNINMNKSQIHRHRAQIHWLIVIHLMHFFFCQKMSYPHTQYVSLMN